MGFSFVESSDTPPLNSDNHPRLDNDEDMVSESESDSELGMAEPEVDSVEHNETETLPDSNEREVPVEGNVEGNKGNEKVADAIPKPGSSMVWEHFKPVELPGGQKKNKCIHCDKLLSDQAQGTTSHMMRHLKLACPARRKLFPKEFASDSDGSKFVQSQLHISEANSSILNFSFDFAKVKLLAAHMILAHEYPFMIVEHKVFNEFLKSYTPHYRKISRYVVRKECFAVFENERTKIKGVLSKVARVGLTTDCWWSGVQRIGYMVITCHYVDRNWNLQKRVLSFVNVPPPHNGVALAKEVHRVAKFYEISDKVASVTVDNASANDVCIDILRRDYSTISKLVLNGKLFHVRCCAHIINLLVRDGLKEIEKVTDLVRDGVKFLFGSENRLNTFNEHRINLQLPRNKLVLDNNTRWNSTYVMLSTAYNYRQCFTKFGEDDESFVRYCPTEVEWAQVHEVCEFLEVFLDVTNLISGSNYPTVNLFLLELCRIKELINIQLDNEHTKHMQSMALRMSLKYDKYWDECDLLLSFGSILDPRYKKVMIAFAFESMYPVDFEGRLETVFRSFSVLYDQYAAVYGDDRGKATEPYTGNLKQPPSSSVSKRRYDEYKLKMQSDGKEKTDLECYCDEPVFPNVDNFDVLAWWKGNEGRYKVLAKMAMDILSIPITTVASESTFSAGGRVIDKKRASMNRDTVEVLLCGGDWIKEQYGIRSSREPNDDPIELEYEKEFEMEDPPSNATATAFAPTAPSVAVAPTSPSVAFAPTAPSVVVAPSATQATPSTDNRSKSDKPPRKKHAIRKTRRT